MGLDILYVGAGDGTSRHRANALGRLGHRVVTWDPGATLPTNRVFQVFYWRYNQALASRFVQRRLSDFLAGKTFDVGWVDSGTAVSAAAVGRLRSACRKVVHVVPDDPFSPLYQGRFRTMRPTLRHYHLNVFPRLVNVAEAAALGAHAVCRHLAADEVVHAPGVLKPGERARYAQKVVFVGNYMPGRDRFLLGLIKAGIPLAIFGHRWQRAPLYRELAPFCQAAVDDFEYTKTLQGAEVCLGLVNHDNRDTATTRSFEVPWSGSLLCAERTPEHLSLYRDGIEAVFWQDAAECAALCHQLLADAGRRRRIAEAGRLRAQQSGYGNESFCRDVLATLASC